MAIKWTDKHHEIAKRGVRTVLIKWTMDKRYSIDAEDRCCVEMSGATTPEKAARIWAILQEPEPKEN